MKRPAFLFYAHDWQSDTALGACSAGARGVWIELLCLMHQCEPYGHLLINGNAPTLTMIARSARLSVYELRKGMAELASAGVLRRTDDNVIYSARMVRDEAVRQAKAAAGALGGPDGSKSQDNPQASRPGDARGGGRPPKPPTQLPSHRNGKPPTETRKEPPLSSSVSSSVSSPNVDDVVEKLMGIEFSAAQAAEIAQTRPTEDYVDRWAAWIKAPPSWSDRPIGFAYLQMLARREPRQAAPAAASLAPITTEQREIYHTEAARRVLEAYPNLDSDSTSFPAAVDDEIRILIAAELQGVCL